MVNPEVCTGHLNFRDRDSHFIFGDAAVAVVLERADKASSAHQFDIVSSKLWTEFSNNIRNNFGFLNRAAEEGRALRTSCSSRKAARCSARCARKWPN